MNGKSFLIYAFSLAACAVAPAVDQESIGSAGLPDETDGLAARYTFDNSDATDSTGNHLDGTETGSPTYPSEHGGRALLLNGTSQWVTVPDNRVLSPSLLTACAWVKPEKLTWPMRILEKGVGDAYSMYLSGSKFVFAMNRDVDNNTVRQEWTSNGYVRVHEWNHICASFDGNTVRLYLNGSLDLSDGIPGPATLHPNHGPLTLGNVAAYGPPNTLQGYLDDIRIYGRSLPDAGVRAVYNAGLASSPVQLTVRCPLVGGYQLDGNIYVNGRFTGKACNNTNTMLTLPNLGHYWIGLGNDAKGYQHQEVFVTGSAPVGVEFADSKWLPSRKWKVLIYNVKNAEFFKNGSVITDGGGRPVQAALTQQTIDGALASAFQTNREWVEPFSYHLATWDITSYTESSLGNVVPDGNGNPSLSNVQALMQQGGRPDTRQYDHVFAIFPSPPAGLIGSSAPFKGNGTLVTLNNQSQISDAYATSDGRWLEGGANGNAGNFEGFLHEWLHGVADWNSFPKFGWPQGVDGLHAMYSTVYSSRYPYQRGTTTRPGWTPWYEAFMKATVVESGPTGPTGQTVGVGPMSFLEEQWLSSNILAESRAPADDPLVILNEKEDHSGYDLTPDPNYNDHRSVVWFGPTVNGDYGWCQVFYDASNTSLASFWISTHNGTKAHVVGGLHNGVYVPMGSAWSVLGYPTSDTQVFAPNGVFTGYVTYFQNGSMWSKYSGTPRYVTGNVAKTYMAWNGAAGRLGYPTSNPTAAGSYFERGFVATSGAVTLY